MDCKTCGSDRAEKYCPVCGEQTFHPHQLYLKHFAEETFEGFIHFDSKFFRTVKLLVTRPGQLSVDFAAGKRVMYMKPIPFFLVVNLIFFILPFRNMYTQGLETYTSFSNYTKYHTVELVKKDMARTGLTFNEYKEVFDEQVKHLSKSYIFLYIPVYGVFFALLFWFRNKFFVEHLVFATHFMSFVLLLGLFSSIFISIPYTYFNHDKYNSVFDQSLGYFFVSAIAIYAAIAIRRFYSPPLLWSLFTAGAIGYTFFMLMQYYRLLLFFKIIYLS